MFESPQIKKENRSEGTLFIKDGPTIQQLLDSKKDRSNIINLTASYEWNKHANEITEQEGLENLLFFLDETIRLANEVNNTEVAKTAKGFKENLVYIGENELKEAISEMVKYLIKKIEQGQDIYIYIFNHRSEKYIAIRILDEFHKQTADKENLREKMHFSRDYTKIAKKIMEDKINNPHVIIPDDFILSGTRISNSANILQALIEQGMSPEKATSSIEAMVIGSRDRKILISNKRKDPNKTVDEFRLNIYSYYQTKEYFDENGKWCVFPGISLTGSHCSTDYGYEDELLKLKKFHEEHNNEINTRGLPVNIERPYSATWPSLRYIDEVLEQKWQELCSEYKI